MRARLCNRQPIAALQHGTLTGHHMTGKVVAMRPRAQMPATTPLADGKAINPMIWSMEFGGMGKNPTALIDAVVQTNLRIVQQMLSAKSPEDMLQLQQQFASDYMAFLLRGTMAIVDEIKSAAAGLTITDGSLQTATSVQTKPQP